MKNILFIFCDQLRYDTFGFQGYPVSTPNIDRLAEKGRVYTRVYTNAPLCAPARMSLMTGTYPHENGVWNNEPHILGIETANYVKELKTLGYTTSMIGKAHLYAHDGSIPDMREAEPMMHEYGFDHVDEIPGPRVSAYLLSHMTAGWQEKGYWPAFQKDYRDRFDQGPATVRPSTLPDDEYPDVYVGRKTCDYLENCSEDAPWFCFVGFGGPHEPWDAPRAYEEQYDQTIFPEPLPAFEDANPDRAKGLFDVPLPYSTPDAENIAAMRKNYAANISLIDEQIGNILNVIEKRGEIDSTAIIFSSDHGEMNGDHGRVYKSNFLEPSAHVPLIILDPDVKSPEDSNQLVELMDVATAVIELAGGSQALLNPCSPLSGGKRSSLLSELDGEYMIRTDRWKAVFNGDLEPYMLFDMVQDPTERTNLAGTGSLKHIEVELLTLLKKRI